MVRVEIATHSNPDVILFYFICKNATAPSGVGGQQNVVVVGRSPVLWSLWPSRDQIHPTLLDMCTLTNPCHLVCFC